MKVLKTSLEEVLIVEPQAFSDSRGFFMETYQKDRYEQNGIDAVFVQDNFSSSVQGTLRGLHYQFPNPQKKLVQVLKGMPLVKQVVKKGEKLQITLGSS